MRPRRILVVMAAATGIAAAVRALRGRAGRTGRDAPHGGADQAAVDDWPPVPRKQGTGPEPSA